MTKNSPSDFDEKIVRNLAEILSDTGLTEIEVESEHWRISLSKTPAPVTATVMAPAAAPIAAPVVADDAAAAQPENLSNHPGVIVSPMVGMAYTLPEPGAPEFVNVGDKVAQGDTVLLIEAMKVFNPIKAPRTGTVKRILVENSAPVEFGEPLMIIE